MFTALGERLYTNFIVDGRYWYLINGLKITLIVTFFAVILGIVIGLFVAVVKVAAADTRRLRPLEFVANLYVTVIRGTPVMMQLLIIYFVVFAGVRHVSQVLVAVIAFGINSGAYVSETIRSGILAVDRGQTEAGRSLGFTSGQTYRYIVLPQAIKNILPALGNEFISLLKETAVVGYIGMQDLTMGSDIIMSRTYDPFVPLLTAAGVYLVIVVGLTAALTKLERRLRQSDNR